MRKFFISMALVGVLGVGMAKATNGSGVSVDNDGNVVFSDKNVDPSTQLTNNTFNPSGGIYQASGTTNTITFNSGVQCAKINGGVSAESGGKIAFDFQGAPQGKGQILNFGSSVNEPQGSNLIQAKNGGEIVFNFFGGVSEDEGNNYILNNSIAKSKILNNGIMSFVFGGHSTLMVNSNDSNPFIIENGDGKLSFNFSDDSRIQNNVPLNIINSGSGKTTLSFKNFSSLRSLAELILDKVELGNNSTGSIELVFEKASTNIKALFENNKTVVTKKDYLFNLKGDSFVVLENYNVGVGNLDAPSNLKNVTFSFSSSGNKLSLFVDAKTEKIGIFEMKWLDVKANNNYISLAPLNILDEKHIVYTDMLLPRENHFTFLEIGEKGVSGTGISGESMNFIVYANISKKEIKYNLSGSAWGFGQEIQPDKNGIYTYADRVFIHSSQDSTIPASHNLGVIVAPSMLKYLDSVTYTPKSDTEKGDVTTKGNIAVATVANASNVKLNPLSGTLLGFSLIETSFEKVPTNDQGIIDSNPDNNTYTTYFLKSAQDAGVAPITQDVTSSAFVLNYDLFIANFNSLNKRMGDLRSNPYSQGAWGRVFNGELSNDFGLGSKSNYTTLQAGYDYDFSLSNAKNYLGVAFAYGFSISEMNSTASNALQNREIKDVFSNNIELALYNAYVEDSGLYSDSIAKFSYLFSDFNLTNNGASEKLNVNNYAFQLSEEVGYVFGLGGAKEWSITPQAELSFGYYSDSDLTQVAGEFYLDAKAKSLLMLRARVGAMVGYDFKQYTQDKNISATLYAGLSYEYDYLSGGDIELTPNVGKATTTKSALSSDGRGVLNLGTNISLQDDIRLYADFQTSFGGKINTDYQINLGARFSFGERGDKDKKDIENLPLKIEG